MPSDVAIAIVCEACGVESLGTEDDDSTSVVVLCPTCAEKVDDDA